MTFGRPQTIGSELFDSVEKLVKERVPNAFALQHLKAAAEKLSRVDALQASIIKSGIAALEWDNENAERWVRNACALKADAFTYMNAVVTFTLLNDLDRAAELAQSAVRLAPQDLSVVSRATESMITAGWLSKAQEVAVQVKQAHADMALMQSNIKKLTQVLDFLGIPETQLQSEIRTACQVAAASRTRVLTVTHKVGSEPDGGLNYYVTLEFAGNLSDELALEDALTERLANEQNWNPLKLSVEFSYEKTKDELQTV